MKLDRDTAIERLFTNNSRVRKTLDRLMNWDADKTFLDNCMALNMSPGNSAAFVLRYKMKYKKVLKKPRKHWDVITKRWEEGEAVLG